MAVKDDYKKAMKQTETAYKNAVSNADKAITKKTTEVNAVYSDINEKAAERRGMTAFKNAAIVNGEGATGTSRLAESVNYENMRNDNSEAKTAAKEALKQQALQLGYTADADLAQAYADNISAKAAAAQQAARTKYENAQAEEDEEYQQAIETLNEFGKVMTKKQAKILGVPVGTTLKKYYSSSGGVGLGSGASTGSDKPSAAALEIINNSTLLNVIKNLHDQGNKEAYGAGNDYYSGYLNVLGAYSKDKNTGEVTYHSTNNGTFGDGKVRDYLKGYGITNEEDIIDIFAAAGLPYSLPRT